MTAPLGPPKARPAAAGVSLVLGLALIGVAVVAVRDLAVDRGWESGTTWTGALADQVDGLTAGTGVVVVGTLLVVIGLALAWTSVAPAARTHEPAPGDTDLWVTRSAVREIAVAAAQDTPGVADATARRRRGRLEVTARSSRDDLTTLTTSVETSVRTALHGLSDDDITIRTKKVDHDA